ncbi:MAG: large repetitive protein [Pseudomonadota bacterium]|nr:large repetitive protein [Pseudomonadota bacterium]
MLNKLGLVALRIIFVFILGLNASAFGEQVVAGDNAPRGARDNVLNVADLLLAERFVLGLEIPTAEEFKVANVAPLGAPDNDLNVADLLVIERAMLGLVTLSPIDLDSVAPTIAIATNDISLVGGEAATLTFYLSEPSSNFTESDVAVSGGTLSNFAGSGAAYTATLTPTANSTAAATVNVSAGVFTDAAGNGNIAAAQLDLYVNTVVLTGITISPTAYTLYPGQQVSLTATGSYSNSVPVI